MSDPARPCGPSLCQSVRYLIGLDVAQWARRNRIEPPWFILTRIGAVALAPAVVFAGVLVFGAGYAFGATLWSLSVERTRGLGLPLAIGVISALVGIGSSGLRSSVSNVLLSSNASHLIAIGLHPLSLLVHRAEVRDTILDFHAVGIRLCLRRTSFTLVDPIASSCVGGCGSSRGHSSPDEQIC